MKVRAAGFACGSTLLVLSVGCVVTPVRNQDDVAQALEERVGHPTALPRGTDAGPLSDGMNLEDGLSATEAVALALWNNAAFRAELAKLGIARAEVLQAGLLRNPVLSLLFPVGAKQLEAGIMWQVESIWRRPRRVRLAQLNLEGVAEGLVKNGLDVVQAVKLAYVEVLLTDQSATIARERAALLTDIEKLSRSRLRAGDISRMRADEDSAAALEAELTADGLANDVEKARSRLMSALGIASELDFDITLSDALSSVQPDHGDSLPGLAELFGLAWAARPDLRAAELRVEAAGEEAGLARSEYLPVSAVLDFNEDGKKGSEVGPGIAVPLFLFDRGQGAKARAAAELERARHDYAHTRNRIAAQVREAHVEVLDAQTAFRAQRDGIVPLHREAVQVAERSHAVGEIPYQDVLSARIKHLNARSALAQASADRLKARARLENAIGSAIFAPSR